MTQPSKRCTTRHKWTNHAPQAILHRRQLQGVRREVSGMELQRDSGLRQWRITNQLWSWRIHLGQTHRFVLEGHGCQDNLKHQIIINIVPSYCSETMDWSSRLNVCSSPRSTFQFYLLSLYSSFLSLLPWIVQDDCSSRFLKTKDLKLKALLKRDTTNVFPNKPFLLLLALASTY